MNPEETAFIQTLEKFAADLQVQVTVLIETVRDRPASLDGKREKNNGELDQVYRCLMVHVRSFTDFAATWVASLYRLTKKLSDAGVNTESETDSGDAKRNCVKNEHDEPKDVNFSAVEEVEAVHVSCVETTGISSKEETISESPAELDLSWMRDIPTKPDKVECLLCNKVFTRKYCTNTHMILKHSQSGGVKCQEPGCGRVCANQSHYDRHFRNMHGEFRQRRLEEQRQRKQNRDSKSGAREKQKYMCHKCPKQFSRLEYLKGHMASQHDGVTKFSCNVCKKGFFNSRDLRKHKCTNQDRTPKAKIPCTICGKRFTKQWMKPHISIEHKGEKETCPSCNKQFSCKGSLHLHYRNMHEGIKVKCSHCDSRFRDSWRLKMHVAAEHEGKRYPCTECGKEYRTKDNLSRHRKIHQGIRFKCEFCETSFGQKAPLTRHIRRKHADETSRVGATAKSAAVSKDKEIHEFTIDLTPSSDRQEPTVKNDLETSNSQEKTQSQQILHQEIQNAVILGGAFPTSHIRLGNIGNFQTLTVAHEDLAQITQHIENGTILNLEAFPVGSIVSTGTDGSHFTISTTAEGSELAPDVQPVETIAVGSGVSTATASTTTRVETLASLAPLQDGDKGDTKFYIIPSGSWAM